MTGAILPRFRRDRLRSPFPHIYRNFLVTEDLRQTGFSRLDAQIGTDITIATRTCVDKFARDVRKVGSIDRRPRVTWPLGSSQKND